jgi:hypothetical protein
MHIQRVVVEVVVVLLLLLLCSPCAPHQVPLDAENENGCLCSISNLQQHQATRSLSAAD